MIDDVHFGEQQYSPVHSENNLSLNQDHSAQDHSSPTHNAQTFSVPVRSSHHGQKAVTEMIIGPWYLDEFGNPTREIKARD